MPTKELFHADFEAGSREGWIALIEKELGSSRGFDSLRTEIEPGLFVDPCYTPEATEGLVWARSIVANKWLIAEELEEGSVTSAEALLQKELVILSRPDLSVLSKQQDEWVPETQLFVRLDVSAPFRSTPAAHQLPDSLALLIDPFRADHSQENSAIDEISAALDWLQDASPDNNAPHIGCASSVHISSSGAMPSTQLAYIISSVAEWCHQAATRGLSPTKIAQQLTIEIQLGNQFYTEVASLRALKLLLYELLSSFANPSTISTLPHIHARTPKPLDREDDHHRTLLNCTTSALSAVLGQSDSILLIPPFFPKNLGGQEEARRLVKNILLMLRHESHLNEVVDPLAGSYYVETLSSTLAERAWDKFLDMETNGGIASEAGSQLLSRWIREDLSAGGESE